MSLLDNMSVECSLYNKIKTSDGEGGFEVKWAEGAHFHASIALNDSMEARRAEADGFKNVYTVIMAKSIKLDKYDVFKRLKDGKVFRITSDPSDMETPPSASLNIRKCSAEEWRLTNE